MAEMKFSKGDLVLIESTRYMILLIVETCENLIIDGQYCDVCYGGFPMDAGFNITLIERGAFK